MPLSTIEPSQHLNKEQFIELRKLHLKKKGLSAKRIYWSERSRASLYKIRAKGWNEYIFIIGFVLFLILSSTEFLFSPIVYIYMSILCALILIVKIRIRREIMWKKTLFDLKQTENDRLNIEWDNYTKGESFSPVNVKPSWIVANPELDRMRAKKINLIKNKSL